MRYTRSAVVSTTLVLLICTVFGAATHALHQQTANDEGGDVAAESDSAAARVHDLMEQREREMRERIERMWEEEEFETDSGGIIPFRVFWRKPGTLTGLALPDVLRRGQFDEWCERIGLKGQLDGEESEYLERAWGRYADEVNNAMLESYPPVFDVARYLGAADRPMTRAVAARADELSRLTAHAMHQINVVERRLLNQIAALRDGEFAREIDQWRYERQWERSMAIHTQYPGANIHLNKLLRSINREWPKEHVDLQRMYEMDIAQAARRYYSHRLRTMGRLNRLQAERFYDSMDRRYEPGSELAREARRVTLRKARGDRTERMRHQRRLYGINTQYLTILIHLDNTDTARLLEQAFHEQVFPDIYPIEFNLMPAFQRFVSDDGFIAETIREDVHDLAGQYEAMSRAIQENAKRFILRYRERDLVEMSYHPDMLTEREQKIESYINSQHEISVAFAIRLLELVEPALEQEDLDELRRDIVNVVGEVLLH